MDIVTDLTSQCVSFITVAQEVYKHQLPNGKDTKATFPEVFEQISTFEINLNFCSDSLKVRVWELIVKSEGVEPDSKDLSVAYFFNTCKAIFSWLNDNEIKMDKIISPLYFTAYEWRGVVRQILYRKPVERLKLVEILQYIPIQIIFCLGGKDKSPAEQRQLQVFIYPISDLKKTVLRNGELNRLSPDDKVLVNEWWDKPIDSNNAIRRIFVITLLQNDTLILKWLLDTENPVPFENVFIDELREIALSRENRRNVSVSESYWNGSADHNDIGDPYKRAQAMNLYGLAFSGGGIRSATFNLGILQKLAEIGILARFDCLSTVSGGGYIGSWFTSWVKRSGSLAKVGERLDPKRSADPLADEVRPIRWLRMFSNYLSPNASLMSTDAWTAGMTWLRNTLMNQVLLFMLLCSVLSIAVGGFGLWIWFVNQHKLVPDLLALLLTYLSLFSGAFLAGVGMSAFTPVRSLKIINWEKNPYFYAVIQSWAVLSAFLASTWLFNHSDLPILFTDKAGYMAFPAIGFFAAFLIVGYTGGYQNCNLPKDKKWTIHAYIIGSSIAGALCGSFLLIGIWYLFEYFYCIVQPIQFFTQKLAFVFGIPLIIEAMSITVVLRMTIMGILFPDLRREWWGRIGAIAHRFMMLWILVTFAILLMPQYFGLLESRHFNYIALLGGWSAIIGYAVKLAFNSKKPEQSSGQKSISYTEIFIRFAPYLFAVGFVLFGSIALNHIYYWCSPELSQISPWSPIFIGFLIGLVTLGLSDRIGVNEFSLHHFYRNRLTRAYLGATRRREAREGTVNSFTGFDQEDDLLLTDLTAANNYFGPYSIINTTLNATVVTDLDRQDRKGESFIFTPKYCGFDVSRTRPSSSSGTNGYEYAYRPSGKFAYPEGPHVGTAMTISGAAVSPNMGYHSSPATAFLLTLFNVRLGWWIGNPRTDKWINAEPRAGLIYLLKDLMGKSDITSDYVYLSDGGHFDNMGLYELVRRHCSYIVVCDAEEDENTICEGLANAIRLCRIDFGVDITINLDPITKKNKDTNYCKQHIVQGKIWYPRDIEASGTLVYIKTSLTGKESVDIREYFLSNPAFPQQSTADQFFDESQFESYRNLGYESINGIKPIAK